MGYSVYIHVNKVNGKKYVGVTTRQPEKRWRNGEGYKDQPHFYSSIQKYGWDSFDHYVVEVESSERMYELEKFYIQFYHTTDTNYGYNKSLGGESGAYLGRTKEEKIQYLKDYYRTHKDKWSEYYEENRDTINEKRRERYRTREEKRERVREYGKDYRERHREEVRMRKKHYYENNKERLKQKQKDYYKSKHNKDVSPITPLW